MPYLISACLLGMNCKYSGGNNLCPALLEAIRTGQLEAVPVCPEQLGGLPTPRAPAERRGKQVVTKDGRDVTAAFTAGAQQALALAQLTGCTAAILKANSPSCGCGSIYDGSFTGQRIAGYGVTAALLRANGIPVYNEDSFTALLAPLPGQQGG